MVKDLQELICNAADKHDVRRDILQALVYQESGGAPYATRFEPKFYKRHIAWRERNQLSGYVPYGIPTLDTERVWRSTSIGLCQLLGETLRWHYLTKQPYLATFYEPSLNLDAGASFLAHCLERREGNYTQALRLYNGGSDYPPKILEHVKKKSYLSMYPPPD